MALIYYLCMANANIMLFDKHWNIWLGFEIRCVHTILYQQKFEGIVEDTGFLTVYA